MADDLYDRDFFLWTRKQAQALRARQAGANDLDWDRLAEEIEDVGSEQLQHVRSCVRGILERFFLGTETALNGQQLGDVMELRYEIEERLTTALKALIVGDLERLHKEAFHLARLRSGADAKHFDYTPRWTWEQIIGEL